MRHFEIDKFLEAVQELSKWECICEDKITSGTGDETVTEHFAEKLLVEIYKRCQDQCRSLGLRQSLKRLSGPAMLRFFLCGKPTWAQILVEFRVLREAIESEVADRRFASVDSAKQSVLDEVLVPSAEWQGVWKRFPKSKKDCEDAAYCYALERNTAYLFHSMRIAEHGLRKLAKKFKVTLIDKGTLQPYEYAEWDKIITATNTAISAARALPKGPKRKNELEALSDAAQHCTFMKDIWRNTVSHTSAPLLLPRGLVSTWKGQGLHGVFGKSHKIKVRSNQ